MKLNNLHYDITNEPSVEEMLEHKILMRKWVTGGLTVGIISGSFGMYSLLPVIADPTNTFAKMFAISFIAIATLAVMAAYIAWTIIAVEEKTSVIRSEDYVQDVATVSEYLRVKKFSIGSEEKLASQLLTEKFVPHVGFRRNGFLSLKRTRKGVEVVVVKAEKLNKIR